MPKPRKTAQQVIDFMLDYAREYPEMLEAEMEIEDENGQQQLTFVVDLTTNNGSFCLVTEDLT